MCFVMGFLWAEKTRRPWSAAALGLLALSCREDLALPLAAIGVLLLFRKGSRQWGAALVTACLLWVIIVYSIIIPANSPSGDMVGLARWSQYGATPLAILTGWATHPSEFLASVCNHDAVRLLRYLFFLPLIDLSTVIPIALPWMIYTTSSFPQQSHLAGAYGALFVPFLFAGAIRVMSRGRLRRWLSSDVFAIVFCALLLGVNMRACPFPSDLAGVADAHAGIRLVNRQITDKNVLGQGDILPHLGWPEQYDMIGSPTAEPIDAYDVVLVSPAGNPWPLSQDEIRAIAEQLTSSETWHHYSYGRIEIFSKTELQ